VQFFNPHIKWTILLEIYLRETYWQALSWLLLCIRAGEYVDRDPGTDDVYMPVNFSDAMLTQSVGIDMLHMLDKYDCQHLRAAVHRGICDDVVRTMNNGCYLPEPPDVWFVEHHYSHAREAHGGTYPEELYPAFSQAWLIAERYSDEALGMRAIMDQNLPLAAFTAKAFHDKLKTFMAAASVLGKAAFHSTSNQIRDALWTEGEEIPEVPTGGKE
jgi:hypothetical protein